MYLFYTKYINLTSFKDTIAKILVVWIMTYKSMTIWFVPQFDCFLLCLISYLWIRNNISQLRLHSTIALFAKFKNFSRNAHLFVSRVKMNWQQSWNECKNSWMSNRKRFSNSKAGSCPRHTTWEVGLPMYEIGFGVFFFFLYMFNV